MIVARDYEALAEHFVDLRGEAEEAAEYKARNRVVGSAAATDPANKNDNKKTNNKSKSNGSKAKAKAKAGFKPLTKEEKITLIKQRVRGCWWGPRVPPAVTRRLQGKEIGNIEDGESGSEPSLQRPLSPFVDPLLHPQQARATPSPPWTTSSRRPAAARTRRGRR